MRDFDFLKEMHRDITEEFRQTVDFIENCYKDGFKQPLTLFCLRADYVAHESEENNEKKLELKQTPRVTMLHQHVLSMAKADTSPSALPPNHTDTMVAKALHMRGGDRFSSLSLFDRLLIESRQVANEVERISNGRTKYVFLLLRHANRRLKLHPKNFSLILDDQFLVAVAVHRYTRATPQELTFTREIIRRSTAIQDTYRSLLAHTKRMQQNHFIFPNSTPPLLNVEATPELGVFGCLLGNIEDGTVLQQFSGEAHQMKTKLASENEGGIWKGKSVYDSPLLV